MATSTRADRPPTLAITVGEPAGIGPELCAMLAVRHAATPLRARLVIVGDAALLRERAARAGLPARYVSFTPERTPVSGALEVWDHPVAVAVEPGRLDVANAPRVLDTLAAACDAATAGTFDALVTAPVQKSVLLDAGIAFTGHTEFFAERTATPRVVMMLASRGDPPLRVALVTTHLPLRDVPAAITREAVSETIAILERELRARLGIAKPRIAVCGLNPHAGEGGHLGREDIDVIAPALETARAQGADVTGPLPADTVFVPDIAQRFDAIVAMYHDQGLPVLKAASFGHGVNVTLGLPFIRTSVDHGTALDLAADAARAKTADAGSLVAAVELAIELAER